MKRRLSKVGLISGGVVAFFLFLAEPLFIKQKESFADKVRQKVAKGLPTWAEEQIIRDLRPYTQIDAETIDEIYALNKEAPSKMLKGESWGIIKCKVKNHNLSFESSKPKEFKSIVVCRNLQNLASIVELADCEFLVSLADDASDVVLKDEESHFIPVFTFAKDFDNKAILMPDFEALDNYNNVCGVFKENLIKGVVKSSKEHPWEQKCKQLFWRGATTGGNYLLDNWESFPRSKLVLLSEKYKALINARFQGCKQASKEVVDLLMERDLLDIKRIWPKEHLTYKYLMDVDGNSCSYSRVSWILFSNSLLVKQKSRNIQWYYGGLKAGEHFVQVENDLSDLMDKLKWMQENDESCKKISENANTFAKEHLTQEANFAYLYYLIQEYAKRVNVHVVKQVKNEQFKGI